MSTPAPARSAVGGAAGWADETGYDLSTYARRVKGLLDYGSCSRAIGWALG